MYHISLIFNEGILMEEKFDYPQVILKLYHH